MVRKTCNTAGQKWISKMKRTKDCEDIKEPNDNKNFTVDPKIIIEDLINMRVANLDKEKKKPYEPRKSLNIIKDRAKLPNTQSMEGSIVNEKALQSSHMESITDNKDGFFYYNKFDHPPKNHLIYKIDREIEQRKRLYRESISTINNCEYENSNPQ